MFERGRGISGCGASAYPQFSRSAWASPEAISDRMMRPKGTACRLFSRHQRWGGDKVRRRNASPSNRCNGDKLPGVGPCHLATCSCVQRQQSLADREAEGSVATPGSAGWNTRLRIWGSGVRISSGAPVKPFKTFRKRRTARSKGYLVKLPNNLVWRSWGGGRQRILAQPREEAQSPGSPIDQAMLNVKGLRLHSDCRARA